MLPIILLAIAIVLIVSLILYARWNYGTLEGLGIKVVKPNFIFGSTFNSHNEVIHLEDIARFKKYGPVYGVYEGRIPQIHICDPNIIKIILVKDFESFHSRREIDFGSPILNELAGFMELEKWRLFRQISSPTLGRSKIKAMSLSMCETVADSMIGLKNMLKKNGGAQMNMDVRDMILTTLTDMVMRSTFNLKIYNHKDTNNAFVDLVKRITLSDSSSGGVKSKYPGILQSISYTFPFLKRFQSAASNVKAAEDFVEMFRKILNDRKKSGRIQKDYTETVLCWMDKLDTPEFKRVKITELTLLEHALTIFLAAQDSISQILTYLFLQVGTNPEIEDKIYKELDGFLKKHQGRIEYEYLNELTYLTACLNEALRLVQIFVRIERRCNKDWQYGDLRIKKGMMVIIPIWATNRHPEYFPDPEKFDPERFMPDNKEKIHPYAYTTFGFGPKNCVGAKYSLDVLLLVGANLYKYFQFRPNPDTKIKFVEGSMFLAISDPINLDVLLRDTNI